MNIVSKSMVLTRVLLLSVSIILFSGIEYDALAGKKKPLKFKIFQKKTVKKAKPNHTMESPNPVVDDTPIIPRKFKKDTSHHKNTSSKKSWVKPLPKKKKK